LKQAAAQHDHFRYLEEVMPRSSTRARTALRVCVVVFATVLTLAQIPRASEGVFAAGPRSKGGVVSRCKTIKAQGVVKFSDWQFPANLNPYTISALVQAYVDNAISETLFVYDSKARLQAQMATAVPTVKNGGIRDQGKTIVIHLKKNLFWSNGATITSADVKFGFQVGSDKVSGPVCSGSCDVIARIDTPDKYTVVFHLKRPYVPVLAYGIPPVIPTKWKSSEGSWSTPHAAAESIYGNAGYTYENSDYPTNGPYKVTQFVKDDRVTFAPMKYYRNLSCGSRLKTLIFAFYSDKAGLIAAAASGNTDVTGGGGGYTQADMPVLQQHAGTYKISNVASFSQEHFEFNLDPTYKGKANPLSNLKVRQALALGLDKMGLVRSALSASVATAKSIIAWSPWVNTPKLVQPYADKTIRGQWDPIAKKYTAATGSGKALQDARKLLNQTPYKGGFSLDLYTSAGNPVRNAEAGVVQSNWKQLGVNVSINFSPASKFFSDWATGSELNHGAFQVALFGFTGSPDPDQIKYNVVSKYIDREKQDHSSPLNDNYSAIHDPAIDKAMAAGGAAISPKVRAQQYAIVQQHINQQAYWIPLYFRPNIATADSKVKNVANNPTQAGPTWNISAWRQSS
jgi:peptide/nickel transport system substrate-binding protein